MRRTSHHITSHHITSVRIVFLFLFLAVSPAFAAKNYNIKNDSTSFLFIDGTSGNVGIGTTVPAEKLEVNGVLKIGGTGASYFNGNVGVGVSSPSEALEVSGTVKATAFSGSGAGLTSLPPAGTTTQVQYNNAGAQAGAANLVYNGGNVGINSTAPTAQLNVVGTTVINGTVEINLQ